jgi:hypothetical protein
MMTAKDKEKHVESLSQRRELSDAARALLNDKAFSHVYWTVHQRWFGQLVDQKHAGPMQDEYASRLRAIEDFLLELGLLLPEYAARRDARA